MTEAILYDGVRKSDLSVDHVPDFSKRLDYNGLYAFCTRLDEVSSPHFIGRVKVEVGPEALKRIVVYTIDIQDSQTEEIRTCKYVVDLSSFGLENEDPELIYLRNERAAMINLREEWGMAYYSSSFSDQMRELKFKNCEERFRREVYRLAQP